MKLGELVSEFRANNNLTMEEFAKRANLSKGYISMIEKDCNPRTKKGIVPTFSTLKLIAGAMGIDVNSLILALDEEQPISWNDTVCEEKSTFSIELAEKIKFLRKQKGLTQGELAEELNVAKSTIAMYEIGRNFPNVEMLHKLCKTLNTTGDYLIGLSDSPEKKFVTKGDSLSPDTAQLIDNYNKLNSSGKEKASDYVEDLTTIDKYTAAAEIQSKLG